MTEPQQLTIHLSGDAVVAPALRIIQQTVETVSFCLIAVDSGDMSKPAEFERARMQMRFSGDMSPDERRALYTNWLLSNGFQELARGIRATLDEALLYTDRNHTEKAHAPTHWPSQDKVVLDQLSVTATNAVEFADRVAAIFITCCASAPARPIFARLPGVRASARADSQSKRRARATHPAGSAY